jgi:glycosyltransferase involved in cell wall biosynthesis
VSARLRVAFVGSVVPAAMGRGTRAFSPAGNGFQRNLLECLRRAAEVETFSMRPLVAYPGDRTLLHRGRVAELEGGAGRAGLVPFINLRGAKEGSLALSFLAGLRRWARRTAGEPRALLVYNLFSPFALPVLATARRWRIPAVAIVADLPFDVYSLRGVKGVLERMDLRAQLAALRRFDGLVVLTRHIAEDFAPGVPWILMEGAFQPGGPAGDDSPPEREEGVVMYSGMLNEMNGIPTLLEAFGRLRVPGVRLRVFGGGPLAGLVEEAARRDPRIRYRHWDTVPADELRVHQRRATVLVNPRPAGHRANRYTFPSKLMEYLASGTLTVSTTPAGIPEEYHPHLERVGDDSAEALAEALGRALRLPAAEREGRGARARAWVLGEKSWERQGARIAEFLSGLAAPRRSTVAGAVRTV